MADNIAITPGAGATVATDDVSSVHYQVVKIGLGADGALDNLVDSGQQLAAASLPVVLASDHSDVKITLDSEAVVLGAGSAGIGKLTANAGVTIGAVELVAAQTLATVTTVGTVSILTGGGVAHDATATSVNPHLVGAYSSAAAPTDVTADGEATRLWCLRNGSLVMNLAAGGSLITATSNALNVNVSNATIAVTQSGTWNVGTVTTVTTVSTVTAVTTVSTVTALTGGSTAHDADATGVKPLLMGGYSSAAAPASVSADSEAVNAWYLRNGAAATVLTAAGALIGGDATNGLDVDVTRFRPDGTNTMPAGDTAARSIHNIINASTSGGATTMNATSSDGGTALTSTAQAIKGSAGILQGYYIYNPNSVAAFVQFYNTAQGSVTVGTTSPLFMLTIPPGTAANLWTPGGITFGTAMSWSATSTAGGNGAPTTALDAVAWYV